jgi:hypothetical protein
MSIIFVVNFCISACSEIHPKVNYFITEFEENGKGRSTWEAELFLP